MSLFSGSSGIGVCYSLSFFPRVAFIFIPLLLLVWAFSNASISLSRSFSFRVSCQTGMCLFSRMNVCVLPHFDVSPEHACILDWDSTSLSSASTYLNSRLCVEDPSFYLLISAGLPRLYRLYLSFLYLQETRQRSRISTFTLNNREFFFFYIPHITFDEFILPFSNQIADLRWEKRTFRTFGFFDLAWDL